MRNSPKFLANREERLRKFGMDVEEILIFKRLAEACVPYLCPNALISC